MLKLIMGRAGTGKTTYIRRELARRAREGESGMLLLVPEQFSFACEKELLLELGERDAARVEVLTFTRLIDVVAKEYGEMAGGAVSDSERVVMMSLALEAVQDRLRVYTRNLQSAGMVSSMLQMAGELTACSVETEQLEQIAGEIPKGMLREKLSDLALISGAYNALLAQHYQSAADGMTWLWRMLGNHPFFFGKTVALDAFHGFTTQEFQILKRILAQAETVYVSLCAPADEKEKGLSVFSPILETAEKLKRLARESGAKVASPVALRKSYRTDSPALNALEQGLFTPCAGTLAQPDPAVTLFEAVSPRKACDYIARTAKKLMRTKGVRCRDMAVIARSVSAYRGELQSAFVQYGVPVFEDDRQPVASQPLMQMILNAFAILDTNFDSDAVLAYLKTGLTGHTVDDVSEVENYTILWSIDHRRWLEEWENHPGGFETSFSKRQKAQLDCVNRVRRETVLPLLAFKKACENATGKEIAAAAYRLLEETGAPKHLRALAMRLEEQGKGALALEQGRIWDLLMKLLDQMAGALQDRVATPRRFGELLRLVIESQDLGHIPEGLDNVAVGSADRMRPVGAKIVFLLGANEGEFPGSFGQEGVFSSAERKKLKDAGLELFEDREQLAVKERFWAYLAMSAPSEALYVTWSLTDRSGAAQSPSALVRECRRLLPECPVLHQEEEADLERVEGKKTAFALAAERWKEPSVFSSTLKAYFEKDDAYKSKCAAVERAARQIPLRFEEAKNAEALFGKDMMVSASRVETFYHCPFQYFVKFGLNAKPRRVAQLDPMQSGTIIHYVLEQMLREYGGAGLGDVTAGERRSRVEQYLHEYLENEMGIRQELGARFDYLFRRLADTIAAVIEQMAREFQQSLFEPAAFEMNIGREGDVEPLTLELPDGGTLALRGQIDRVDVLETDKGTYLRVVDYKSGAKQFLLSDVLYGLNMQMLLYLVCVCRNGKGRFAHAIPAGVLYMPAKRSLPTMERGAGETEIEKEHARDFKMNGMVLEDETVLRGMERRMEGAFIPAKMTQSKGMTGTLITAAQLGRLTEKLEGLLREMGQTLHAGGISPYPVAGAGYSDTCKWCDYKTVCAGQEQKPERKIEKLDHKDSLKRLEEGEADGKATVDQGTE